MPNVVLLKKLKSDLAKLDLSSFDLQNFHPHIDNTFKRNLLTDNIQFDYDSIDNKEIKIKMSFNEYNEVLCSDFLLGSNRIKKQIESLEQLLESKTSPVAWNIVTTYYATFFMAVEICKLLGIYLIHIDKYENMEWELKVGESISDFTGLLLAERKIDEESRDVYITIKKFGDSPHMKIWDQLLGRIKRDISKKNTSDKDNYDLELFRYFLSETNDWKKPSVIRNLWNYNRPDYYHTKGEEIAETFSKIIKDYRSSVEWAKSRSYSADITHNTSALAYLFHILKSVNDEIDKTFFIK